MNSKRYQSFGAAFKTFRNSTGHTQQSLADLMGIHAQFISNCERGMCALPKEPMRKLVKKLRVSPADRGYLLEAYVEDREAEARKYWKGIL